MKREYKSRNIHNNYDQKAKKSQLFGYGTEEDSTTYESILKRRLKNSSKMILSSKET